ncbi:ATP-binding protein [Spirochaeta dissipatitropha]
MEITQDIQVSFEQKSLIDMHSVLNILNILVLELSLIDRNVGGSDAVQQILQDIYRFAESLRDSERIDTRLEKLDSFIFDIREAVTKARLKLPARSSMAEELEKSALNIENVISILRVRGRELTARPKSPCAWVEHHIPELHQNFHHFFSAVEYNSHGAYNIVERIEDYRDSSYLILLAIRSPDGENIRMPAVFQDVVRDLIANARKYSPPGGRIETELLSTGSELCLKVSDNGKGIPGDEIERVVLFGERGSNVREKPTRGGGFGLTKAYFVTRCCNGRMWIDSEPGRGTSVTIRLPIPA